MQKKHSTFAKHQKKKQHFKSGKTQKQTQRTWQKPKVQSVLIRSTKIKIIKLSNQTTTMKTCGIVEWLQAEGGIAPFLLSGASTRGTRDTHTSPQLPLSTIPGSHKNWKLKPTKFGSLKDFIDVFGSIIPGISRNTWRMFHSWSGNFLGFQFLGPSVPPFKLWTQIHGTSHTARFRRFRCSQGAQGSRDGWNIGTRRRKEAKFEDSNGWKYVYNVIINHTNAFTAFTPYTW